MHEIVSFSKDIEFKNMINKITSISLEHTLMLEENYNIKGDFIISGTYKMTAASQIENDFSYKIPVDIEVNDKYNLANLVIDIDDFTYEVIDEEILRVNIDLLLDKLEVKEKLVFAEDLTLKNNSKDLDEIVDVEDLFMEKESKEDLSIREKEEDENKEEEERKPDNEEIEIIDASFEETPIIENETNAEILEQSVNNNTNVSMKRDNNSDTKLKEVISTDKEEENNNIESSDQDSPSLFSSFDSSKETYSTYSIYILREGDTTESIINKYKTTREALEEYNDLSDLKIGSKIIIPTTINE